MFTPLGFLGLTTLGLLAFTIEGVLGFTTLGPLGFTTLGLWVFTTLGLRDLTPISGFGLQSRVIALRCVDFIESPSISVDFHILSCGYTRLRLNSMYLFYLYV